MQQVITISPGGSVSGLQHKKGKGLDLRSFGHAKVERASEIVWNESSQMWEVSILTGPLAGKVLRDGADNGNYSLTVAGEGKPLGFTDYEDAVAVEVKVLNALRRTGQF